MVAGAFIIHSFCPCHHVSSRPKADKSGEFLFHHGPMEQWVHWAVVTGGGQYELSACYASPELRPVVESWNQSNLAVRLAVGRVRS